MKLVWTADFLAIFTYMLINLSDLTVTFNTELNLPDYLTRSTANAEKDHISIMIMRPSYGPHYASCPSVCPYTLVTRKRTRNPHAITSIKPRDAAQLQSIRRGVNRKERIFYLAVQL